MSRTLLRLVGIVPTSRPGFESDRPGELWVGSYAAGLGRGQRLQFTLEAPYLSLDLLQVEQLADVLCRWAREQRAGERKGAK